MDIHVDVCGALEQQGKGVIETKHIFTCVLFSNNKNTVMGGDEAQ